MKMQWIYCDLIKRQGKGFYLYDYEYGVPIVAGEEKTKYFLSLGEAKEWIKEQGLRISIRNVLV